MTFRQKLANLIRQIPLLMKIPYYVYRFFQPKYSIGVVGVVMNEAQEILLVEHVFHPRLAWGLPGGWIGFNEDPSDTVVREIREELGLSVDVRQLLLTDRTQYHHIDFAYLCSATGEISSLSYELLDYAWYKRGELPRLHSFHYRAITVAFDLLDHQE